MAQTYSQLQSQILKLQVSAEAVRKSELAAVLAKIRVAISAYGIGPKDLFDGKSTKSSATKSAGATKSKSTGSTTAKFADDQGNTWLGRGPRPTWLRDALAEGRLLNDFVVAGSAKPAQPTSTPTKPSRKATDTSKVKAAKKPVAAKYKDEAGNTWTGRGSQPRWLKTAVAAGKSLEQFLV